MANARSAIKVYGRRYFVRLATIFMIYVIWLLICNPGIRDPAGELGGFFFVALIEILTVNLVTKRDFYPADLFIDAWFPNRSGLANKAGYTIVYLLYSGLSIYMLFFELCNA